MNCLRTRHASLGLFWLMMQPIRPHSRIITQRKSPCKMTRTTTEGRFLQLSPNVCLNFDGRSQRSLAHFSSHVSATSPPPPPPPLPPSSLSRSRFARSWATTGAGADGENCSTQRARVRVPPQTWGTHPHARGHVRKHKRDNTRPRTALTHAARNKQAVGRKKTTTK